MLPDRKGIESVITSLVLIGVGIVMAMAAMLWIDDMTLTLNGIDNLDIKRLYVIYHGSNRSWTVKFAITNMGPKEVRLLSVILNGVSCDSKGVWSFDSRMFPAPEVKINTGQTKDFTIILKEGDSINNVRLIPGLRIALIIHTSVGDYFTILDL